MSSCCKGDLYLIFYVNVTISHCCRCSILINAVHMKRTEISLKKKIYIAAHFTYHNAGKLQLLIKQF